jgi:hypothetical protein
LLVVEADDADRSFDDVGDGIEAAAFTASSISVVDVRGSDIANAGPPKWAKCSVSFQ